MTDNGEAEKSGFGERLSIAMKVTGVRQADVARASGIDQAQLSNMVRQQASLMSIADVFLLLTVLFGGLAVFAMVMKKPEAMAEGGGGH